MPDQITSTIARNIRDFHLPRYEDIPNVGLYLEQTVSYITEYLNPIQKGAITGSMVANYVKKKLVANPVRKQYSREQIALLIFIAVNKSVLALDNIRILLEIKGKYYETGKAYDYFCDQLEHSLEYVFGQRGDAPVPGNASGSPSAPIKNREEKDILQSTVIAVANKIYLEKWIDEYARTHFPENAVSEAMEGAAR
jgi:hypothetical protein